MTNQTTIQKINKLEKELAKLKKAVIQPKKYEPVICNGLMWSEIAPKKMNWEEAMEYAKNLKEGGYNDWRLPTIKELYDVFDYGKGKPKIEFGQTNFFWSSTEYYDSQSYAWRVYLGYGYACFNTKTTNYAVRCVRRVKGGK